MNAAEAKHRSEYNKAEQARYRSMSSGGRRAYDILQGNIARAVSDGREAAAAHFTSFVSKDDAGEAVAVLRSEGFDAWIEDTPRGGFIMHARWS